MGVTHTFHSDVADGDDDSVVQPSDWNADHDIDLDASDIPFTPTGTIAATNVQTAIAEAASEDAAAHIADTSAAHAASAVSFTPTGTIAATDVQAAIAELGTEDAAAHIADTSAAHAASAVSVDSTTLVGTGTDAQAVFEELDNGIADHIADTSAAHAASAVSVDSTTLVGTGTDAQAVFEELDNGIADHLADTTAAHAASAISADSTTLVGTGTDVQAVFEELDNAIVATETVANNAVTKNGGGKETLETHGNTGGTETINLANGNVHDITTDSTPAVLTFSGSTASVACSFTLIVRQGAGGSKTVTWPASVDWPGGVAPTLSTVAASVDVFTFVTVDNGTTWLGFTAGLDVK